MYIISQHIKIPLCIIKDILNVLMFWFYSPLPIFGNKWKVRIALLKEERWLMLVYVQACVYVWTQESSAFFALHTLFLQKHKYNDS